MLRRIFHGSTHSVVGCDARMRVRISTIVIPPFNFVTIIADFHQKVLTNVFQSVTILAKRIPENAKCLKIETQLGAVKGCQRKDHAA